jgi:hypothetical protein
MEKHLSGTAGQQNLKSRTSHSLQKVFQQNNISSFFYQNGRIRRRYPYG